MEVCILVSLKQGVEPVVFPTVKERHITPLCVCVCVCVCMLRQCSHIQYSMDVCTEFTA